MNLRQLYNQIITNEKSRDLHIEIIVNGNVYLIGDIESDFKNGALKCYAIYEKKKRINK
tara:strand:+ start:50 stop:226 length:177 start_codon:yes stop_codon:yes gene_type:complete